MASGNVGTVCSNCFAIPAILQTNIYTSTAASLYEGGILEVKKRFSQNITLLGNYTYSHAWDDTTDFNSLAAHFGSNGALWTDGDFNYDGSVDTTDFNLLASNFGQALPAQTAATVSAPVPEPSSTSAPISPRPKTLR